MTIKDLKSRFKLGATGTYPQGKLNQDDEGGLHFSVSEEDGVIKLDFGKQVSWIGMPPEGARQLAAILIRHADSIERSG